MNGEATKSLPLDAMSSAFGVEKSTRGKLPEDTVTKLERVSVGWWRLALLGVLVAAAFVIGHATGLTDHFSTERVRAAAAAAGTWGPIAFVFAFCIGELLHVPGALFVASAVLVYGRVGGGALALAGALASVAVSFLAVRAIGGKPLAAIRWPLVRRILANLDDHPLRTVFLLRLLLWMAPQLNYALALSNLRFRDYLIASALGLLAPIAGLVLFSSQLLH